MDGADHLINELSAGILLPPLTGIFRTHARVRCIEHLVQLFLNRLHVNNLILLVRSRGYLTHLHLLDRHNFKMEAGCERVSILELQLEWLTAHRLHKVSVVHGHRVSVRESACTVDKV